VCKNKSQIIFFEFWHFLAIENRLSKIVECFATYVIRFFLFFPFLPFFTCLSLDPITNVFYLFFLTSTNQTTQSAPKVLVVSDLLSPFVPAPLDDLLVHPADPEARQRLEAALDLIPTLYQESRVEGSAMGSAVQVAQEVLVRKINNRAKKTIMTSSRARHKNTQNT
jgi:hypothetical protein